MRPSTFKQKLNEGPVAGIMSTSNASALEAHQLRTRSEEHWIQGRIMLGSAQSMRATSTRPTIRLTYDEPWRAPHDSLMRLKLLFQALFTAFLPRRSIAPSNRRFQKWLINKKKKWKAWQELNLRPLRCQHQPPTQICGFWWVFSVDPPDLPNQTAFLQSFGFTVNHPTTVYLKSKKSGSAIRASAGVARTQRTPSISIQPYPSAVEYSATHRVSIRVGQCADRLPVRPAC